MLEEVGKVVSTAAQLAQRVQTAVGASTPDPRSLGPSIAKGQVAVERCFALGWHIAELYGLPSEARDRLPETRPTPLQTGDQPAAGQPSETSAAAGAAVPPPSDAGQDASTSAKLAYLTPPKDLPAAQLNALLQTEIVVDLAGISAALADDHSGDSGEKLKAMRDIPIPLITQPDFAAHVRALDEKLLEALTAAGFRLEKAYSIGRGLYPIAAQRTLEDLREVGVDGQLFSVVAGWLRDMKTSFATCATDTVVVTLMQWQNLVSPPKDGQSTGGDGGAVPTVKEFNPELLQRQGEIWRSLLSGEKAATDYLNLGDYVSAGQHLVQHYAQLARTVVGRWWVWIGAAAVISLAVTLLAIVLNQGSAVIGVGAAVLGLLGVTSATVTGAVRQALQFVQQPLWEAEITDAMIVSTSLAPVTPTQRSQTIEQNWRAQKHEGAGRAH
jgi:hypothetical protein